MANLRASSSSIAGLGRIDLPAFGLDHAGGYAIHPDHLEERLERLRTLVGSAILWIAGVEMDDRRQPPSLPRRSPRSPPA
jgi:hypothetical protein